MDVRVTVTCDRCGCRMRVARTTFGDTEVFWVVCPACESPLRVDIAQSTEPPRSPALNRPRWLP